MIENCVYDMESGQLLTGSYMDYCMPRAGDLPSFRICLTETPCTHNPLRVKGCGEAGAIAAPPAVINAHPDALGIPSMAMHATPEKLWRPAHQHAQAPAHGAFHAYTTSRSQDRRVGNGGSQT